jgi:hypothetical protein
LIRKKGPAIFSLIVACVGCRRDSLLEVQQNTATEDAMNARTGKLVTFTALVLMFGLFYLQESTAQSIKGKGQKVQPKSIGVDRFNAIDTASRTIRPDVIGKPYASRLYGPVSVRRSTPAGEVTQERVKEFWGKLPLRFEANQGQTDAPVKFLARGSGYNLFLAPEGAVLTLNRKPRVNARDGRAATLEHFPSALGNQTPPPSVLRMQLVGSNPVPRITGMEQLPGQSNYFIGNDRTRWRTHVSHYAKVRYHNVYAGVDLVYYGKQGQLEYDLVLSPFADPGVIKISFIGAREVHLDTDGELLLKVGDSEIRQPKPVIYQDIAGVRKQIAGGYRINAQAQVTFEVGQHDATRPLVIDPVLIYATYLGGSADDLGAGIAVDEDGFAYVAGVTTSPNFPVTSTAFQPANASSLDVFVTKLNRRGTELVYSTYLGGRGDEATVFALGLAVDESGIVYLTGNTTSTDFPTTPGAFQPTFAGGDADAFVTKLNRRGTELIYSTYLGGSECGDAAAICFDVGFAIAVDEAGNAYVTGATDSTNFPTTQGAFQSAFAGSFSDTFVTKLNRRGTALLYSTYLGGSSFDPGRAIAVDKAGHAYVLGDTGSPDFPTTPGSFQPTFGGGNVDVYLTKLNRTGTALVYSTYLGGSGVDFTDVNSLAVDDKGNAYAAGLTDSPNFPTTPGAFQTALAGAEDSFVTKLNTRGTALIYSTYVGGSGFDAYEGIAVDKAGSAYLTGHTDSPDFPTTLGAFQTALAGANDAVVTKLNRRGAALVYSTYLGGSDEDFGIGLAVDKEGNAYVVGQTGSTNFPTTPGSFQPPFAGSSDAFIAKIGHDHDDHADEGDK